MKTKIGIFDPTSFTCDVDQAGHYFSNVCRWLKENDIEYDIEFPGLNGKMPIFVSLHSEDAVMFRMRFHEYLISSI